MSFSTETVTVFEVLAEGGSISIQRQRRQNGDTFIFHFNEYDPVEDIVVTKADEYDSFEDAFNWINDRYPWYKLHLSEVDFEYLSFIAEMLVNKLNSNDIPPDDIEHRINHLENVLYIDLRYDSGTKSWILSRI